MNKKKLYLLYLFGCIIAILISSYILFYSLKVTNNLNDRGVTTTANVTKVKESLDYNDKPTQAITFEFYDILNNLQTAIIHDGSEKVGDKVLIIYDPNNPKRIMRLGGSYKSSAGIYIIINLLIFIILFIVILFKFLILFKKKKKYKQVEKIDEYSLNDDEDDPEFEVALNKYFESKRKNNSLK